MSETASQVRARMASLFDAIEAGRLYQLVRTETRPHATVLHFRRHHSVFQLMRNTAATEFTLLHDGHKARPTMLREMLNELAHDPG